ncbi:hypothetical protein [Flavobacterium sp. HJSW_4]|uniref:hypothetical protein n=1 Tax=Flavobacterium sp. HJSW_4 TaxID=3344660 RepID=UPI0035F32C23
MNRFFYIFILFSFTVFSQEISVDDPTNKIYLPNAKQNTVSNLEKYKGQHIAKSVDKYKFVNNEWQLTESYTGASEINYFDYYLTFKRSYFKEPLIRYLLLDGYNAKENYYFYTSYYGEVHIYGGFKKVVLFDKPDPNGNPTNKYIFNF